MILVDTSIWIQHLRSGHEVLAELLDAGSVVLHPFVLGELALGNLSPRELVLNSLQALPQATVAMHEEVLDFIETNALYGLGIGYVDAHLLASVRLTPGALLWTRDKRLQKVAERSGLAWRWGHGQGGAGQHAKSVRRLGGVTRRPTALGGLGLCSSALRNDLKIVGARHASPCLDIRRCGHKGDACVAPTQTHPS